MNILGINEGHMCSAALIKDDALVTAACEERFSRNKNQQGFPENAANFCLEKGEVKFEEIDYVATATMDLPVMFEATKRYQKFTIYDYVRENEVYWKPKLLNKEDVNYFDFFSIEDNEFYDFSFLENEKDPQKWFELFRRERIKNIQNKFGVAKEKIIFVDHHTGHASYAYFMSPYRENVLILTADAWGDGCNSSISIGNGNNIVMKFKSPNNNLARLYRNMTLYLGMKPNEHEYKVMGLAPYATEYQIKKPYEIFKKTLKNEGIDFVYEEKPTDNYYWFKERLEGCRFDGIAGALQKYVEEIMSNWVIEVSRRFKSNTIVMSGGMALNIKVNKVISELPEVEKFFVAGGGGDESESIGAALYVAMKFSGTSFSAPMHDYHGPNIDIENFEKEIERFVINNHFSIKENKDNHEAAELLKNDQIVARCTGRSEFGPRALGNRSILANPSNPENIRKINNKIKYRDFWMPFTPSILSERVDDYVLNPKALYAPFMTIAFESTDLAKKELIAALHPSDFTLRPQFVTSNTNQDYYDLIKNFEKLTGIGGLLNTSLNLHGEPIVGSIKDALHTLTESDLDAMIIENKLLVRKK